MKRRILTSPMLVIVPLCFGVAGCAGLFSKGESGPGRVDDLLGRIERVHVECELSEQSMMDALAALDAIVAPDFAGDPVAAYEEFVASVDRSEKRASALRASVTPMKSAAGPFFDRWAADLSRFDNMQLRLQSQARLEDTHARYEAILRAVEPTQAQYDDFNARLRDHALFLGHDFNASSVAAIGSEVDSLSTVAEELRGKFDVCRTAAEQYVRSAALPGQMENAVSRSRSAATEASVANRGGR